MWYQITAGEGSAYLTEQADDAHHSRDAYEAQPEPRIRHSSHAWLFLLFWTLKYTRNPNALWTIWKPLTASQTMWPKADLDPQCYWKSVTGEECEPHELGKRSPRQNQNISVKLRWTTELAKARNHFFQMYSSSFSHRHVNTYLLWSFPGPSKGLDRLPRVEVSGRSSLGLTERYNSNETVSPREGWVFRLELPLTVGCFTWSYHFSCAKAQAFLIATWVIN